jgi:hypothetical protein
VYSPFLPTIFRGFPNLDWVFGTIDLSVSPSSRMQMSQWQLSISCTGTGTQTSLGFSAIEKHWKIRSSHRFDGVYAPKMVKRCAWGTCNTDSRSPERIGNGIYFYRLVHNCSSMVCSRFTLCINPMMWAQ